MMEVLILQDIQFTTIEYIYFDMFSVKFRSAGRRKRSHCQNLTLSCVRFGSLLVGNYQTT